MLAILVRWNLMIHEKTYATNARLDFTTPTYLINVQCNNYFYVPFYHNQKEEIRPLKSSCDE